MQIHKKVGLILAIFLLGLSSLAYWGYKYFFVVTDDAYVNGNIIHIAPRINGRVAHLYVVNNQFVKAGEILFDLDPDMYATLVAKARANLAINQAKLKLAELTETRLHALVKKRVASIQEGDSAEMDLQAAKAGVELAKANLATAELNLGYTHITAPESGWVTNLSTRVGDMVMANQPVFLLINNQEFWVDANFKETELQHIRVGQSAEIKLDMYSGQPFQGIVESISNGSGAAFSIFPPENATGNWVKVTQRIPVRIKIITLTSRYPLRLGASANVKIHIKPWQEN